METYKGLTGSISVLSLSASLGIQINIGTLLNLKSGSTSRLNNLEEVIQNTWMGIRPFSLFTPLISTISLFQSYLGISFVNIQFHIQLLELIGSAGKSIILPVGVLLRAFKVTRNGGNALIAIFLAFYVMYPLTIDFLDGMVLKQKYGSCKAVNLRDFQTMVFHEIKNTLPLSFGELGEMMTGVKDVQTYVKDMQGGMCNDGNIIGELFVIFGFKFLFVPFFAIFVALGFARVFASLLGTEIDFSSLMRVV